jgi:hypothetical protein
MDRQLGRLQHLRRPLRLSLRMAVFWMLLLWSAWFPLWWCASFSACSLLTRGLTQLLACTLRTVLDLLEVLRLRLRLMVLLILKLRLALWCLVVVVVVGRGISRPRRCLDGQGLIC